MLKKLKREVPNSSSCDDITLWDSIALIVSPFHNNKVPYKKHIDNNYYCTSSNNRHTNYFIPGQTNYNSTYNTGISSIQTCSNSTYDISSGLNLNNNTKKKIDNGKYCIDATLDLHGYTLDSAHDKLLDFIIKNYNLANKCLLIITGWGSTNKNNSNSIKSNFSKWLQNEQIAKVILYYTGAINAHGGKGAFYVLLKSKHKQHNL